MSRPGTPISHGVGMCSISDQLIFFFIFKKTSVTFTPKSSVGEEQEDGRSGSDGGRSE